MKLNKKAIDIQMAKKQLTVLQLAKNYGATRSRIHLLLNSRTATPATVGKLAAALGCDVTEIIED